MKKSILNFISAMLIFGASSNVNASLASNAVLDFNDGVYSCLGGFGTAPDNCTYGTTVIDNAGSYWAFDASGDGVFQQAESIAISSAGTGLTLGSTQARGEIDLTWSFSGNPGEHYTQGDGPTLISSSGDTASVSMLGWTVWWGAEGSDGPIDMGHGVDAIITCGIDCSLGDSFVLDYSACIPTGTFPACPDYFLHLEGTIAAPVPIPAAVWLFGSGLIGLVGFARRK